MSLEELWAGVGNPTETAMLMAYEAATKSPDPSTQTGAVLLTRSNDPVRGCNNFPTGVSAEHWTGPKEGKYARVVHAEMSVLLKAARLGYATAGSIMVAPWAACSNCSKHIVAAGVETLVRHRWTDSGVDMTSHWYEDCLTGDDIMVHAGVNIQEIDPVPSEVELRRDGKLWRVGR